MQGTRTWIIAAIALIIGGGIGYAYMQRQVSDLAGKVSALESQLAEAMDAAQGTASELEGVKGELGAKTTQVDELTARLSSLEGELAQANERAQAAQAEVDALKAKAGESSQ